MQKHRGAPVCGVEIRQAFLPSSERLSWGGGNLAYSFRELRPCSSPDLTLNEKLPECERIGMYAEHWIVAWDFVAAVTFRPSHDGYTSRIVCRSDRVVWLFNLVLHGSPLEKDAHPSPCTGAAYKSHVSYMRGWTMPYPIRLQQCERGGGGPEIPKKS